ncbi:MAG: adenylate/guanylate cyclase domain-containing protein [Gammaproteobacteria bacterium]|nr:adenylate/guanylate cyclase domain-containing protein [Gammaproteobacteria bacterium]
MFTAIMMERYWALVVLAVALTVRVWDPAPLTELRLKGFDFFQLVKPSEVSTRSVTIVDIDERSLAKVGQWPWPRTTIAKMIDKLRAAGVIAVGLDMLFPEPDRMSPAQIASSIKSLDPKIASALNSLPDSDLIFADSIRRFRVVLGQSGFEGKMPVATTPPRTTPVAEVGNDPRPWLPHYPSIIRNIPVLEASAHGLGMISFEPDGDGILRRASLVTRVGKTIYPALSIELLRVATGQRAYAIKANPAGIKSIVVAGVEIPTDKHGRFWIHFSSPDRSRYVSANDVLAGTVPAAKLKGKLVLIGTSAIALRDTQATPLHKAIPGVELQAILLENIISKDFISRPNYVLGAEVLITSVLAFLLIFFVPKWGSLRSLLGVIFVMATCFGAVWYAYIVNGLLFDVTFPTGAALSVYMVLAYFNYRREERSKRQLRSAFSRYISPALVNQLVDQPKLLVLGGETKDLTVLFTDIRGFTTISESYDAQNLTNFINHFFTPMTDVILDHKGTVDKYIGDCVMAFWNAPVDVPEHPESACRAALEMYNALEVFNESWGKIVKAAGRPYQSIEMGTGINTGSCCVGNLGSSQRFDYSVLGDSVNLASRLEAETKKYGVDIIIGESTQERVPNLATIELDVVRVKGKTIPTRIFALMGDEAVAKSSAFLELKELNQRMLAAARDEQWDKLGDIIEQCRRVAGDRLASYYDIFDTRLAAQRQ